MFEYLISNLPTILEAGMLIAFSASWPIKLARIIRFRRIDGISTSFVGLILIGYVCGTLSKVATHIVSGKPLAWITLLYLVNAGMVAMVLFHVLKIRLAIEDALHSPENDQSEMAIAMNA